MSTATGSGWTAERLRSGLQRLGVVPDDTDDVDALLRQYESVCEEMADRLVLAEARVQALSAAHELVAEGLVVADAAGRIVHQSGLAGPWLSRRTGGDQATKALLDVMAVASSGRQSTRTLELMGPPHRSMTVIGVPVCTDEGASCGSVVVLKDTTEDRHLEAVRRDFVANVSHELKTPIGALGLLADTMVVESDPDVMARLVERMQLETIRVGQVIDDLLNLSRIEAANQIKLEMVNVASVIDAAMNRVRFAAEHRKIHIDQRGDLDATIYGGQHELVSAVHHLLENALKYSSEGSSVEIDVSTDGEWTQIAITDHGVGIAPQYQERIFERFYRVDDARTRATGGTGLGLAIVRHVVHNHGGEVWVTSKEGEGSTFTLKLAAKPSVATERLVVEGGSDG